MRASMFVLGWIAVFAAAGVACSGSADSTSPDSGAQPGAEEAGTGTSCRTMGCGAECCSAGACWYVDATGASVDQIPSCSGPVEGPPVGPTVSFAGDWSPISGSGQQTCSDGETTGLAPDTLAVYVITSTGPSTLQVQAAGTASSCVAQLTLSGNVAAETAPTNCDVQYVGLVTYTTFSLTLNEPDAGTVASVVADAAAEDAASVPQDTLTFQVASTYSDSLGTCNSSLVYTLARVN